MSLSFKGGKISYNDSGKGSVIVLLHGYLESAEVWKNFSNALSSGFRIITIDLPGHGQSGVGNDINTMEFMASAVKDVIDDAGISKIFLIGHSMGGYVTLAFLELFSEYLTGYCLFHSHPLADVPEIIAKRKRDISFIEDGKKEQMIPQFIQKLYAAKNIDKLQSAFVRSLAIASKTDKGTIIADLKGMMARSDRAYLIEEGKVPFLWILGAMDSHIDYQAIQQKVRLPENAKVVVLKNSGHLGFIEEEDLSVKVLEDFVKRII